MHAFRAMAVALATGALVAGVAGTADAATQGRQGDVTFVNGGVTSDEADALRAEAPRHPLEITFARRGETPGRNEFIAEAQLRVLDAQGRVVLDRPGSGPILLADLPAGNYTIEATYNGETRTQHVRVGAGHAAATFLWP
jgi:hypothetical protein